MVLQKDNNSFLFLEQLKLKKVYYNKIWSVCISYIEVKRSLPYTITYVSILKGKGIGKRREKEGHNKVVIKQEICIVI